MQDKQSEYGKQKDGQNFSLYQICDSKSSWNIKQFTAVLAKNFPSMAPEFLLYNYEHHHKGSCIGTMKTGHGPHMTWHTGARHPLTGICNGRRLTVSSITRYSQGEPGLSPDASTVLGRTTVVVTVPMLLHPEIQGSRRVNRAITLACPLPVQERG